MGQAFTYPFRSFVGGEISPGLWGRIDQTKYQSGLATCRNWFVRREGSASNRCGHEFICPMRGWVSDYARPIPFVFNNGQSYTLLLTASRIAFVREGAPILEATKTITGITAANPPVVTSAAHGYVDGEMVYIDGVVGMTELNGRFFTVNQLTADTYALQEEANIDGTGYTAYTSGGTSARVYSIASPYAGADLAGIRYKQSADVMILVHDDYAPQKLERLTETSWTLTTATFEPDISQPNGGAISGTAGGDTVRYKITAVAEDTGEESFAGRMAAVANPTIGLTGGSVPYLITLAAHGFTTGDEVYFYSTGTAYVDDLTFTITVTGANTFTLNDTNDNGLAVSVGPAGFVARTAITSHVLTFPTSVVPVNLTWTAVAAAQEYNIYREINGIYAYIGTAASAAFEDLGYTADPFNTPPVPFDLFSISGYPSAIGFFQQRLVLGGFDLDPERVRASRIGLFYNFTRSQPTQSDDAVSFITNSGQVNRVKHFEELERLIVFTQGNVITIEGDDAGTLTPTAINARIRSSNGIADVPPLTTGTTILFCEYQANVINEIIPNQPGQAFQSRDISVFASHLFEGKEVVDWTWASKPYGIAWAVRDDGIMLGLTYLREQEVWGWHHHDTGDGDEYVGACAIPESGEAALYVLVRRYDCNGQTRIYCERMPSRAVSDPADGRFLDSYVVSESANADAAKTYTLLHNGGNFLLRATGTTTDWITGDESADIGRVILLYADTGERMWCTVNSITTLGIINYAVCSVVTDVPSGFDADGNPLSAVDADGNPTDLFPVNTNTGFVTDEWSQSVERVTNLWHLEGRTIKGLGDGHALDDMVVTNGAVDLPGHSVVNVLGLAIVADLQTLEPDTATAETWADKSKRTGQVSVKVERTLGLSVGLDRNSLQDFEAAWCRHDTYRDRELHTGMLTVLNKTRIDDSGQIFIRQSQPLPATVLGVFPVIEVGDR